MASNEVVLTKLLTWQAPLRSWGRKRSEETSIQDGIGPQSEAVD